MIRYWHHDKILKEELLINTAEDFRSYLVEIYKKRLAKKSNWHPSQILAFTQDRSTVRFTLPQLKYWDMLVIE